MTCRRLGAAGQPRTAEKGGERGRYRVATINGRLVCGWLVEYVIGLLGPQPALRHGLFDPLNKLEGEQVHRPFSAPLPESAKAPLVNGALQPHPGASRGGEDQRARNVALPSWFPWLQAPGPHIVCGCARAPGPQDAFLMKVDSKSRRSSGPRFPNPTSIFCRSGS